MTLWAIQSVDWYERLLKESIIYGELKHVKENLEFGLFGYHWLMQKMDERIGKRPFLDCYPVWAWYQYKDSKHRRPDLRGRDFLPKGTKGVRLEIQKSDKDVLLSDFTLWHFPFSYHGFIGANQTESEAFPHHYLVI